MTVGVHEASIRLETRGRGFHDLTGALCECIADAGVASGIAHLFIRHTSASLIVTENADPDVHRDLETIFARLGPDGDPAYRHRLEGPDDMAAHVRAALTATSLSVPIRDQRPALGTWQGVYLYEHRHRPHRREVLLTIIGA